MATYNDYPKSATNNAKRAIKYKEENGSSCGTSVGWTRARQLANREKISRSTIARMASFKRHQQHKDVPYDEGCGGIMWDAWGGTSGIEWAIRKLKQIDKMKKENKSLTENRHIDKIEENDTHYIIYYLKDMDQVQEDDHYEDNEMEDKQNEMEDNMKEENEMEDNYRNLINSKDFERRTFTCKINETRDDNKNSRQVVGYASVFNKLSEDLGGFREKIDRNAFDDVMENDVRALLNHDANYILARTTSGTLSLSVDDNGLMYKFDAPETTYGEDLLVSLKRGDITQSSFGFVVEKDEWSKDENGKAIRTIMKVSRLLDVSPVTYPAYPDASVGKRNFLQYRTDLEKEENKKQQEDLVRRNLLEYKINLLKLQ